MKKKKTSNAGKWFVILLVLLALTAGFFTWKNYSAMNFSTRVAVLTLPPDMLETEMSPTLAESPAEISGLRLEESELRHQLNVAELELALLRETVQAGTEAMEEAIQMVQEQRENFDFAQERYERLMPLVETGALDLLTASQIQSAYISARASLAQAKFYFGQAQRIRGEPETRRRQEQLLQTRIRELRSTLDLVSAAIKKSDSIHELPANVAEEAHPHAERTALITAFFDRPLPTEIPQGATARVSFPGLDIPRTEASVTGARDLGQGAVVSMSLPIGQIPGLPPDVRTIPCEVTIDISLLRVSPEEETGGVSKDLSSSSEEGG
jgi:hypothetical protein